MNVIHRSKLKYVEFTLATGDLFDAEVDAIVSSEQTDFVLSGDPQSLSGQIWRRYGDAVQRELDASTNGPGVQGQRQTPTVSDTGGKFGSRLTANDLRQRYNRFLKHH
jgi:hypothetical protein